MAITQETAGKIWNAHREIVAAGKLLEDMIGAYVLKKRAELESLNVLAREELQETECDAEEGA